MSSKRPHSKSRLGCRQCKQRHIKCDQRAPCCASCAKKGIECDYQEYAGIIAQQSMPSSFHRVLVPKDNTAFSVDDMLLMHHYSLHTSKTISPVDDPVYHDFWQNRVPALASRFPFLVHAILSVTGAHQALFDISRHHYGKAIATFTNAIKHPSQTEEHADAVFCYSGAVVVITWSLECTNCPTQDDPTMGASDLFGIIHTTFSMLQTMRPSLESRNITAHLWHTRYEPPMTAISEHIESAIRGLEATIIEQHELYSIDQAGGLRATCDRLRWLFSFVQTRPPVPVYSIRWATKLDPRYLDLLHRKDAAAMAIFTFWCVPIHHAPHHWYIGDWPRQVVLRVAQRLRDTVWERTIEWPLSQILMAPSCPQVCDMSDAS